MVRTSKCSAAWIACLAVAQAGCSSLPRDPKHTLDRVKRQKQMRIGLVENPPWVMHGHDGPDGAEVKLIREFADSLGASCIWLWGGEQSHMEAVEHFELDLVAGGFDASSPWSKKVGMTRPYFVERIAIGVPTGTRVPDSLEGMNVRVRTGDEAGAYLAKKHGIAIRVSNWSDATGAAAAPEWRLEKLGLVKTKFELLQKKHVMAGPPGESAWLKVIQQFLNTKRGEINRLLRESEARE